MILPLLLALAGQPALAGVLGTPEGERSELVSFAEGGEPVVLASFAHAAGWLPKVTLDPAARVAYAAVVAEGARHGALASLIAVDLATGERRVVEARVPPRQGVVLAGDRVVYTAHLGIVREPAGSQMAIERFALVVLGGKVLLEHEGYLLWPLFAAKGEVIVLRVSPGRAELIAVSLGGAVRVVRAFGAEAVRDFSLDAAGEGVVYQRALADGRFAVERVSLSGKVAQLHAAADPWMAPLATARGVLISKEGVLAPIGGAAIELPFGGAAIPVAASGARALVHVQAKGGHRYVLLDGAKATVLSTRGLLLESASFAEAP